MAAPFGRSILVLAPHPDDEVVGFAAAIGRAKAAGSTVRALFLTHGCIAREAMWPWARHRYAADVARRMAEARKVAALLGIEVAGQSDRPARLLWPRLAEAEGEARRAIGAHGVDQLWVPAYEGGNPDHDGANALASRLAAGGLSVLEFAEYNLAGGRVRSHEFPRPDGAETVIVLDAAEKARKRQALGLYASEQANLGYVALEREAFRPLAAYDYAAPPHEGRLWYARFQWVPFRHPRVDFTQPAEVSRVIAAYLADGPAKGVNT